MKLNVLTTARISAYSIAAIAGTMSYGHQYTLLTHADLGVYAKALPLTVDALAFSAALVRNSEIVDDTGKRAAGWTLVFAGTMSVVANVAVATNIVQAIAGFWTVASYLLAEYFVSKLKPKPEAEEETEPEPVAPQRRRPSYEERVIDARMRHPNASLAYIAKKADVARSTAKRVLETVPQSPVPVPAPVAPAAPANA